MRDYRQLLSKLTTELDRTQQPNTAKGLLGQSLPGLHSVVRRNPLTENVARI